MPRGIRNETREGEGRARRVPLGTPRLRLDAKIPRNMVGRWVNDSPGRIQQALDGGYSFIADDGTMTDRDGARHERVGVSEAGMALVAYLMAIPRVLYDEDQKAKQAQVDKIDETIKRGNIRQADPKDGKAFYVPSDGISIRHD